MQSFRAGISESPSDASQTDLSASLEAQANKPQEAPWPSRRFANYMLFVLILAFTCSFIDRQIVTLLVGPIRTDLNISDTEFSLLAGLAFALFYSFIGLPIAVLADRHSRRMIIVIGIVVWSLATMACGLAGTYWQLFAARMAVGVGEATLTPAATSMIADSFPPERRGRATAIYATGVYWGSGLALIIGGALIQSLEATPAITVPLIGEMASWRSVFFYVGLPGFVIAIMMLFVREPARRGVVVPVVSGRTQASGLSLLAFIKANKLVLATVYLGFTFLGMVLIGFLTWVPAMLGRVYGWQTSTIGMGFGLVVMIAGTAGMIIGGWLSDHLQAGGRTDAPLRAGLIGGVAAVPFAIAAPLMPTGETMLAVAAVAIFCITSTQALPIVAIQAFAPNHIRAQLTAVYFVVGSLLIFSAGPTLIAVITDYVFIDDTKIGWSLAVTAAILAPAGALTIAVAHKPFRQIVAAKEAVATPTLKRSAS